MQLSCFSFIKACMQDTYRRLATDLLLSDQSMYAGGGESGMLLACGVEPRGCLRLACKAAALIPTITQGPHVPVCRALQCHTMLTLAIARLRSWCPCPHHCSGPPCAGMLCIAMSHNTDPCDSTLTKLQLLSPPSVRAIICQYAMHCSVTWC